MYLKSIRLSGYKTFAEKATIDLLPGISVVVGPNGCGKSNLVDAVRWVIGGHSAKQVRGVEASDMIFNGSNARKPMSRASVELMFDNTDGGLGDRYASYSEISVRRDINRDGESDYYLNDTKCRRMDVVHIFLGTGLGSTGYAMIEQGSVSRLAEGKPEELRALIEEAAGVSRYRIKRKETMIKMDRARAHLERVNDKRVLLDGRMKELRTQARRAERHARYQEQTQLLQAQKHGLRARTLRTEQEELQRKYEAANIVKEKTASVVARLERETEELAEEYDVASTEFQDVRLDCHRKHDLVLKTEEEMKSRRKHKEEYRDALEQLQQEHVQQAKRLNEDEVALKKISLQLAESVSEYTKQCAEEERFSTECSQCEQSWQALTQTVTEGMKRLSGEHTTLVRAEAEVMQSQSRSAQLEQQLEALQREESRLAGVASDHDPEEDSRDYAQLKLRVEQCNTEVAQAQTELESGEATLTNAREAYLQVQNLGGHSTDAASRTRDTALSEHWRTLKLEQVPLVVERLSMHAEWVKSLCLVLECHLHAYCLDDIQTVHKHIEGAPAGGKVLGFVEQDLQVLDGAPEKAPEGGVWLHSLLEKNDPLSGVLSELLHGVVAVEDTETALRIYKLLSPGQSVVSREGVWLGRGFARVASNMYDNAQHLRELEKKLNATKKSVEIAERAVQQKRTILSQRKQAQEQSKEALLTASQAEGRRIERQERAAASAKRMTELVGERTSIVKKLETLKDNIKVLHSNVEDARARTEKEQINVKAQQVDTDKAHTLLKQARTQLNSCTQRVREVDRRQNDLRSSEQSSKQDIEQLRHAMEGYEERCRSVQKDMEANSSAISDSESVLKQRLDEYKKLEKSVGVAQDALTALQEKQTVHRAKQVSAQHERNTAHDTAQTLSTGIRERQTGIDAAFERITELGHKGDLVLHDLPETLDTSFLEKKIQRLDRNMTELGSVNLAASQDLQTADKERAYLIEQHTDVSNSLSNLEEVIRRIDHESHQLFFGTVKELGKHLQHYFKRLFDGGKALLRADGADPWTGGVHFLAQPPGKRNQTIHQLSGGEKTLAALALIFAIFELNRAPFCLLDEVDAALDDLNIKRFTVLLREVAQKIQLVCVSHNPLTMEYADHLLGVTANDTGVSQVVGVNLEEASAMVEREAVKDGSG